MNTIDSITNVLVVGAGTMGSQIAMTAALAGYEVTLQDIDESMLARARGKLEGWIDRSVSKGRISRTNADAAFDRLSLTTDLATPAANTDFVIEAATEKLDIKRRIFAALDETAPDHVILTTNSSTMGSSKVADATSRPDRICNMHFFNPALVMRCVEVVRHGRTSQDTLDTTMELSRRLGKEPILINQEIPGFVANRLLHALRDEALRLYADGIAGFEDIDKAARAALGHPMGPFELMDLVGLDVSHLVRQATYEETGNPEDLPHPAIRALYEQGHYGRKTGKGWYTYD